MGIVAEQWKAKKKAASTQPTSGRAADEWRKKQVDNIPSMLSEIDSYEKEVQSMLRNRNSYWDGNDESIRRKARETNALIKRTQSLLKYTDAYDSDELTKAFSQYSQYNNDVLSRLDSEAEVYSKFATEDEYKAFEADYLKKKEYSSKTSDELEAELQRMQSERDAFIKDNGGVYGNMLAKSVARIGGTQEGADFSKEANNRIETIENYDKDIQFVRSVLDEKKLSELPKEVLTELDSIVEANDLIEMKRNMKMSASVADPLQSYNKSDIPLTEKEQKKSAYKNLETMGYNREEAETLVNMRKRQQNAEMTENLITETQEMAKESPVLTGTFSVVTNLTRGIANLTDVTKKLSGEEIDENDIYHSLGTFTDTVRSTHLSEIDSRAGRIAYSAVTGILDNVARMATGGALGSMFGGGKTVTSLVSGLLAGSQIMEQEIVSGKKKGYSDSKAFGIALTKSIGEAAWEAIGDSVHLGKGKNAIIKLLKSSGVEGGTELATNWTNRLIDLAADMDESELKKRYDSYIEEGKSKGEAVLETMWSFSGEDFDTFLVGAISGSAIGGSVEVMNKASKIAESRDTARRIIEDGSLSELIDTAKELKNSELDNIIKKLDTEKVKAKDVAKLQSKLFEIVSQKEEAEHETELRKAISDRLETLGSVQTEALTDAIYKYVTGKKLSSDERLLLSSKSARRVISEYENRQSGEYSSDWTDLSRRSVTDGDIGTRTLNARAAEYAETAAAEDFKESYESGQSVDDYEIDYDLFYKLGQKGVSLQEALSRNGTNKNFNERQAMNAYHCGWMEGMTSATDTLKTVKLSDESFESISEAQLSDGVSLVNVRAPLNTSMRTQLSILDNYGREKGISFAIVENYSGVYDGVKGEQLSGTNKIILPLKKDGGLLLHTAGHEVFHYIKQQNSTVADEMIEFVTDYYKRIGKYDSIRANYEYLGDNAIIDEEITADSMFDVMTNSDFVNEYASKNKTVFEKIKTTVQDLLAHIKKALKLLSVKNPAHAEIYETLSKDEKTLTKINEMFREATKDFGPRDTAKARERLQEVKLSPHYDNISQESRRQIESNEEFKKALFELRQNHKKVDGQLVDRGAVKSIANKIRKEYQSKIDEKELTDKLCIIYEFLGADGDPSDETFVEVTTYLAKEVLENSEAVDKDLYMQYEPLRKFLKESKISLTSVQKSEVISKYGSVENFRHKIFGKVNLVESGAKDLDIIWDELSKENAELFPIDTEHQKMPETLIDALKTINPSEYIPYESDIDVESYTLYHEMIKAFYNTPYLSSISATQLRESLKDEFKANQRLAEKKREIRRETREKREKIKKTANSLAKTLETNSAKKHVPEILKKPVFELIKTIVEDSQTAPFKSSLANSVEKLRRSCEKMQDETAGELYKAVDLPHDFVKKLDDFKEGVDSLLERYNEISPKVRILDRMNLSQLNDLETILTALNAGVNKINTFHQNSMYEHIEDARRDTVDTCLKREAAIRKTEWKLHDFFRYKQLLPYYFFKHLGKGGQSLFEELADGWDELAFLSKDIKDFARKTYKPEEVNRLDKEEAEIDVIGGKITMTKSQLMSLYCLWQRPQAKDHILTGGITPDVYEVKNKMKKDTVRHTRNYKISREQLEKAFTHLTDREIEIAGKLQSFMSTECAEWGNSISMRRFGTRLFTEKHYFPITVDKSNLSSESKLQPGSGLYDLLNMSFTKDTNEHADNAVVIRNIFDVFVEHTTDMAKYKALALPLLDTLNWYNSQSIGEGGEAQGVKKALKAAYGDGAPKYLEQFIKDINGANTSSDRLSELKPWIRKYKIAKVASNLNVVLVQPTAYLRAGNVINGKYLGRALAISPTKIRGQIEKMERYSGIATWKDMGFYDIDISKGLGKLIRNDGTRKEKVVEISTAGTEWADKITWALLFRACEAEAFDGGKAYGSEENLKQASKRFREVVYSTQVVDSVMTRTEGMRSKSFHDQLLTSFMSEPLISYNMLLDEAVKLSDKVKEGEPLKRALAENRKSIVRCFLCYSLTEVFSAAVSAISGAIRDEDDEKFSKKYTDEFLQGLLDNLLVVNKIPVINRLSEALINAFKNSNSKSGNILDNMFEELARPIKTLRNAVENRDADELFSYKNLYNILVVVSNLTGVAVSNTMRDAVALWNTIIGYVDEDLKIRRFELSVTEKVRTIFSDDEGDVKESLSKLIDKQAKERQKEHPKESLAESRKEATSSVKSKVSTVLKEMYKGGERSEAIRLMRKSGQYTEKEITRKTEDWRLEKK